MNSSSGSSGLRDGRGLRFAARANPDARKRPVREVVGFDPAQNQEWSASRAAILVRLSELAADFHGAHGRPPAPPESPKLAHWPGRAVVDLTVEEVLEAAGSASHDPDSLLFRFLQSTCNAAAAKGNSDRRALDSKPVF
jgi:hypothetical protein